MRSLHPTKIFLLIGSFSFLLLSTSCKGKSDTLVKVGNKRITQGDLDLLLRVNPRLKPRVSTPQGKQKILENYAEQELLYQESTRRGLQRSKDVKDKLNLYEKIIISQALLDEELDKKVKEYYENHRDEFERVKLAHILIRTQPAADSKSKKPVRPEASALKMAEDIRNRLLKGEDFAKLASEVSEDEPTKSRGGDLGYITLRDRRLERDEWLILAEKGFALKAGEVSEAIKTKDGFHVIKVMEEKKLDPFEEVETTLKFRMQNDIRISLLEELKKKHKPEYVSSEGLPPPEQNMAPAIPLPPPPPPAK